MRSAELVLALALLLPAAAAASGTADGQAALNVRSVEYGPCAGDDDHTYLLVEVRVDGERLDRVKEGGGMQLLPAPEDPVQVEVRAAPVSGVMTGDPIDEPPYCDLAEGPERNWTGSWDGSTTVLEAEGAGDDRARVELVLGPKPFDLEGEVVDYDRTSAIVDWKMPEDVSADLTLLDRHADQSTERRLDSGPFAISGLCPGAQASLSAEIEAGPWQASKLKIDVPTESPEPQAPHITDVSREDGLTRVLFEPRAAAIDTYEVHLGKGSSFEATDETNALYLRSGYQDLVRGNIGGTGSEVTHLRVVAVEGDQRNATDAVPIGGFSQEEIDPPRPPCLDEGPRLEPTSLPEPDPDAGGEAQAPGSQTPAGAPASQTQDPPNATPVGLSTLTVALLATSLIAARRRSRR